MRSGTSAAWRRRRPRLSGGDLLAVIATVAFVAGVALALVAPDASVVGGVALWDAALMVSVLAVLTSVRSFPEWWVSAGGGRAAARACAGARERRASRTVDLRTARSPSGRLRRDETGTHRTAHPVPGATLAGATRRSQADWLLEARRRDAVAEVRHHGRPRG